MASLTEKQLAWPAVKVRDTFLDYFKKNGHTFGMLASPQLNTPPPALTLTHHSPFIVGRTSVRPDTSFHKCWHEPVQGHFPRHC